MAEFNKTAASKIIIKKTNQISFQKAKEGAIRSFRDKFFNSSIQDQDEIIARSMLGTPVYDNLIFGDLEDNSRNVFTYLDGTSGSYEPLQINDVLMEVFQPKNIIKTPIQGRNGTIKEYVSDGDYLITASGRITNLNVKNNLIYPEEDMFKLRLILSIPDKIPVISNFLQGFGIFDVIIDDFRIPQERGVRNQQLFEITMSSEEEIDLENVET